jgi:hypothetical protein
MLPRLFLGGNFNLFQNDGIFIRGKGGKREKE